MNIPLTPTGVEHTKTPKSLRSESTCEHSFDAVYRAALLLRRYDVPFNPLVVIHRVNAKSPAEVYKFLTNDLGCKSLQWLPCVGHRDFRTTAPGHWSDDQMLAAA